MEPKTLASQLRCPTGAAASEVALSMNEANGPANLKCIELLQLGAADRVLEIGPGNGAFAADVIRAANGIAYTGVDWSAEMVAEAQRINADSVARGCVQFQQGSSDNLPFEDASFDKLLTVHTLYFWERPNEHLAEIRRVMKPSGLFCMAFGDREFMKDLPFTSFGFTLHDKADVSAMLHACGFHVLELRQHHETGRSNTGATVEKLINIVLCDTQGHQIHE